MNRPDQGEGATLLAQHVAQEAVEHIGRVDHQPFNAVEGDRFGALRNAFGQFVELLVHGFAPCQERRHLGRLKVGNVGPALEDLRLHIERRQKWRALRVQPNPQIAVFDKPHQVWQCAVGLEKLPGQARATFLHVEMQRATTAGETTQRIGGALVVVQQHQTRGACVD